MSGACAPPTSVPDMTQTTASRAVRWAAVAAALQLLAPACSNSSNAVEPVRPPIASPVTALVFTGQPTDTYTGRWIYPVQVSAINAAGAAARDFDGQITLSLADSSVAYLPDPGTGRAVDGTARLSVYLYNPAQRLSLRATAGQLVATSTPFDVLAAPTIAYGMCFGGIGLNDNGCVSGGIVITGPTGDRPVEVDSPWRFHSDPAWSPDAKFIVSAVTDNSDTCRADVAHCGSDVCIIDGSGPPASQNELCVTHGEFYGVELPAWSPRGGRIAFSARPNLDGDHIYVMNADGSSVRELAGLEGRGVSWSPDGDRIAFSTNRYNGRRAIQIVNADGSQPRSITDGSATDDLPAWSPDGTRIAFARSRVLPSGAFECQIISATVDGSSLVQLTHDPSCATAPAWSPDGKQLAYHGSDALGVRWLMIINADGSDPKKLCLAGAGESRPAWAPRSNP